MRGTDVSQTSENNMIHSGTVHHVSGIQARPSKTSAMLTQSEVTGSIDSSGDLLDLETFLTQATVSQLTSYVTKYQPVTLPSVREVAKQDHSSYLNPSDFSSTHKVYNFLLQVI